MPKLYIIKIHLKATARHDIHATWKVLKEILACSANRSLNDQPPYIEANSKNLTCAEDIANEFNNFFSSVGEELASYIAQQSEVSSSFYLRNKISTFISLNPPSFSEVYAQLCFLSPNKSSGADDIPPSFIKQAANVLTPYLTYFIGLSFNLGIFPTLMKHAEVIPVHKCGSNIKTENIVQFLFCLQFQRYLKL